VNNALDSQLQREESWTNKRSSIVQSNQQMQKASVNQTDNKEEELKQIKKKATANLKDEMKDHWLSHLKTLVVQGDFISTLNIMEQDFNYKAILYELPRNVLKFLTNSCIDTLPTNRNLQRWKKRNSPACQLCGNKETLLHVLNNCRTMLDQGRYTWRHNSILKLIFNAIKPENPDGLEIFCDLPGKMTGISTIPTDILVTAKRPDLTIIDRPNMIITLVELTVPFEKNICSAQTRKEERYESLIYDISQIGYEVNLLTIEIGSRGLIDNDNCSKLKGLMNLTKKSSKKELKNVFKSLSKTAITASYCIFYSKYEQSWVNPELIEL